MRLSSPWRLLLFSLFLLVCLLHLNWRIVNSPHALSSSRGDIEAWIDRFTEVSHGDIGYSGGVRGNIFTPLESRGEVNAAVLSDQCLDVSHALRQIVKRGAESVPLLLAHLDDKRPTRLEIGRGDPPPLSLFFRNTPDYNARTTPRPLKEENRDLMTLFRRASGRETLSTHIVTVGDLCFVALGQIVNRDYSAVAYQPTGIVVVTSPTYSPALLPCFWRCGAAIGRWRSCCCGRGPCLRPPMRMAARRCI